ncbi:MAG TPA: sulfatase-like hydrolase/transferase [Myxococcota bacterium]|nr:sulfatase-like hydrolase/transferase [Myxococcota bacterium]
MVLLLLGCTSDPAPAPGGAAASPDIFLITTDATHSAYLGSEAAQRTTPNLDQLFAESVVLPHTLTVRGLTIIAMPSFLSGFYPSTTGARGHTSAPWSQTVPLIQERLQRAGYQTFGFSSNKCTYIDVGMDHTLCTGDPETAFSTEKQIAADRQLVDGLLQALDERDPKKPVFAWIHLILPHDQYDRLEPWYSLLHPEPYPGGLDPADAELLDQRMLSRQPLSAEERRELDAWYQSGLAQTDAHIGRLLLGLQARNLYEDAIVAFGSDHGEELARRDDQPYFYHGCSPYNDVMRVTWSIRAPGLTPDVSEAWVSSTDMAPTLLDLAGVPWKGREAEGRSLVLLLRQERTETVPVYAERGTSTAMVIHKGFKYLLNPEGAFPGCNPYEAAGSSYQAPTRALWELQTDPRELQNLSGQGRPEEAELRQALCAWVSTPGWTDGGGPTTVLQDDCAGG